MNSVKTMLIYCQTKFLADLIKLIDVIWIMNIILITITDPEFNDDNRKNKISFYEPYFRYMEFHILMLAFSLVYNDRNIESEIASRLYTTSAIIGKYDSFRFTVILILSHYYFIFVNSLAFSVK
jgi:hypothetical protein